MERDATSFWADIKKYEDTLAKDPGSCCFAPLAELYRKQGLLDDAIRVAKQGCEIHPDYVGGYMALGRAFAEKGLKGESREALEKVISLTPDNLLALRLLSHLYAEQGDTGAAEKALRSILSRNPDDVESQALLDSLQGALPAGPTTYAEQPEEEFDIDLEDAEIIEELTDEDLLEEDVFVVSPVNEDRRLADSGVSGGEKSPISTVTLAELYISQGFSKRALTIYRELLESDPDNADLRNRLHELKAAIDKDAAIAWDSSPAGDEAAQAAETAGAGGVFAEGAAQPETPGGEDRVIETLERWLEAIRRRQ